MADGVAVELEFAVDRGADKVSLYRNEGGGTLLDLRRLCTIPCTWSIIGAWQSKMANQ